MRYTLLTFLFLTFSYNALAQELEQKFQHILDSTFQENNDAVGILLHVEAPNKKISWTYAVGSPEKNSTEKLHKEQPVLTASNTKTYVAATILKLVENEAFELDALIKELLPKKTKKLLEKSGYDLSKITVRHMLSHTSGITDYVTDEYFAFVKENPKHKWTRDEQILQAMKIANPVEAGKTFAYADINFVLLTEIIEQQTGKPFYISMRELLDFKKHNLNTTWFVDLEETPSISLPLAHQYSEKNNWDSYDLDPSWDLYGGGGMASSTKDLALFFQLLFEGKIITDKDVLKSAYTFVLPKEESNYCLGLRRLSFHGESAYYHGGFWGTDVMYLPRLNASISIFILEREKRGLNPQISHEIIKVLDQ